MYKKRKKMKQIKLKDTLSQDEIKKIVLLDIINLEKETEKEITKMIKKELTETDCLRGLDRLGVLNAEGKAFLKEKEEDER